MRKPQANHRRDEQAPESIVVDRRNKSNERRRKLKSHREGGKGEVNGSDPVFPLQFRSETHFGATIDRSEVLPDAQVCDGGVGEKNGNLSGGFLFPGSGVQ